MWHSSAGGFSARLMPLLNSSSLYNDWVSLLVQVLDPSIAPIEQWAGPVFTPKFGKRRLEDSKPPRVASSKGQLGKDWYQLIWRMGQNRLFFRMTSSSCTTSEEDMLDSTEREGLESKLSLKIEGFLYFQEV
jgi:hypothetical protein